MSDNSRNAPSSLRSGSCRDSSRRLRVASIYRNFNTSGSIESLYLRNAERLAQDEDVTVFTSEAARAVSLRRCASFPSADRPRTRTLALRTRVFEFRTPCCQAAARQRREFDVVHVEGFAAYDADLVTVHAVRAAEIEHYFAHVELQAGVARQRLGPLVRPQAEVVMRIERSLFQRPFPPYCICPSESVKHDLERCTGPFRPDQGAALRRRDRALSARSGCRRPAARGAWHSPDRLVLLFVGSGFERKGLDVAVAGLARSRSTAELWVIGGSDAEQRRVKGAALLGGRVRLLGSRAPAELPAFYSAADVFILPTRQDSWAIPVTEALAASCVAVTSEYAGSCDLITHGVNGYILRGSGSGEELADLLDGPLADPGTRAAVAARGRDSISPYDYESFYAQYRAAHRYAYELARERMGRPSPHVVDRGRKRGSAQAVER